MTPETARWLLDLLATAAYKGSPDELRGILAQHDAAVAQLTAIAETHLARGAED